MLIIYTKISSQSRRWCWVKCYQNCHDLYCFYCVILHQWVWRHAKMLFTDEDKATVKFLRVNKHYGAKHLWKGFITKNWWLRGLNKFLKKIDENRLLNDWKVPVGCGRHAVITALNLLSSSHLVKKKSISKHSIESTFLHKFSQFY